MKATSTSTGVMPPNKKGSAPTGASITMYMPMAVKADMNLPRATSAGRIPVRSTASQVCPSRSEAMLLAARAGPTRVTTKKAREKKVWNRMVPASAGLEVPVSTPPRADMSRVMSTVSTIKMMGVRSIRALWRISRIHSGLGSARHRSIRKRT